MMGEQISILDIGFEHNQFWKAFFRTNFANAYDETTDVCVGDIIDEYSPADSEWWNTFTGYYDGILEEADGISDHPVFLEAALNADETIKIEFHPGDTLFYINNQQIGCTGPHAVLNSIPYKKIEQVLSKECGPQLFLLMLPIAYSKEEEMSSVKNILLSLLPSIFPVDLCESIAKCILDGLVI